MARHTNTSRTNGISRGDITIGQEVAVVMKQDQGSGKLTQGRVARILTRSPSHPHGIKVRLDNGCVGRVKELIG
ncbi:YwbE family protein [Desulfogranum mediterraneum]|uniref:YwbE family protein n=1 Tax=Desulfogranum mediterraneum TaxID=160661 RepID=UPI0004256D7E|nr:YwbE family protein [Desulfogranum mediterraneum]